MCVLTFTQRARLFFLTVAIGLAMAFSAYATDQPLTLDSAITRGLAQAPTLMSHQDHIASMQDEAARAGRLPDPTLNFGVANYPVTAPGAFSLRADTMTMRTVGLTQIFPSRAARDSERELADAQTQNAQAENVDTVVVIKEQVANAWIDLWAAQRKHIFLMDLQRENALAVQLAQARLRGGEGSASEVLTVKADGATLDNRLEQVNADIAEARASLQRWLGSTNFELAIAPNFGTLPVSQERLDQTIDQQAPMQVWHARERMAQADLEQAKAAKRPNWSVSVMYGKRAPDLSDMVTVQASVSLPLFSRNRQDRGISAKQAQRDAVQADHEDARRAQHEAEERAVARWEGLGKQIARYEQTLLPLDEDRLTTALASYRGGGALQPWLDARRDDIERRLSYADALARRAHLWAALAYLLPTSEGAP
jgi:cobalt-zinc-cadmium efflux system outer membrane protein